MPKRWTTNLKISTIIVSIILFWTLRIFANPCEPQLTRLSEQTLSDPKEVNIVLLANGFRLGQTLDVQNQILENLPPGVSGKKLESQSVWIRDWFPLITQDKETGKLQQINFLPSTLHGLASSVKAKKILKKLGIEPKKVNVFLDWGNLISDGDRVFISKSSRLADSNPSIIFGDSEKAFDYIKSKVEKALNKEVVWLPELPEEATGHVDVYLSHLGGNRFIVADSRVEARKKALDEAAEILGSLGYQVTRILNGGRDDGGPTLSYTNTLIVGNRALVPVYSKYDITELPGLTRWQKISWALSDMLSGNRSIENYLKVKLFRENVKRDNALIIPQDDANALETYAKLGFEVFPIYMDTTVELNGMVHCLTRCLPPEIEKLFPVDKFLEEHNRPSIFSRIKSRYLSKAKELKTAEPKSESPAPQL